MPKKEQLKDGQVKRGKGRPQGSRNKPKSVKDLEKMLAQAREREGITDPPAGDPPAGDPGNETLEIETGENQPDTYTCGECGYKQEKIFKDCPECQTENSWG